MRFCRSGMVSLPWRASVLWFDDDTLADGHSWGGLCPMCGCGVALGGLWRRELPNGLKLVSQR